jgi:hypothetical protein
MNVAQLLHKLRVISNVEIVVSLLPVVGFINTDRARSHPDVHWRRELLRDGKIEKVKGTYATVEEALAAF